MGRFLCPRYLYSTFFFLVTSLIHSIRVFVRHVSMLSINIKITSVLTNTNYFIHEITQRIIPKSYFNFFPLNKSGSACHVILFFLIFSGDCTQKRRHYFQNKISTKSITTKIYSAHVLYNLY